MRCPNCAAKVTTDEGGLSHCSECGGSFRYEAGRAKLAGVGKIDALEKEVAGMKSTLDEIKQRLPQPPQTEDDDDDD